MAVLDARGATFKVVGCVLRGAPTAFEPNDVPARKPFAVLFGGGAAVEAHGRVDERLRCEPRDRERFDLIAVVAVRYGHARLARLLVARLLVVLVVAVQDVLPVCVRLDDFQRAHEFLALVHSLRHRWSVYISTARLLEEQFPVIDHLCAILVQSCGSQVRSRVTGGALVFFADGLVDHFRQPRAAFPRRLGVVRAIFEVAMLWEGGRLAPPLDIGVAAARAQIFALNIGRRVKAVVGATEAELDALDLLAQEREGAGLDVVGRGEGEPGQLGVGDQLRVHESEDSAHRSLLCETHVPHAVHLKPHRRHEEDVRRGPGLVRRPGRRVRERHAQVPGDVPLLAYVRTPEGVLGPRPDANVRFKLQCLHCRLNTHAKRGGQNPECLCVIRAYRRSSAGSNGPGVERGAARVLRADDHLRVCVRGERIAAGRIVYDNQRPGLREGHALGGADEPRARDDDLDRALHARVPRGGDGCRVGPRERQHEAWHPCPDAKGRLRVRVRHALAQRHGDVARAAAPVVGRGAVPLVDGLPGIAVGDRHLVRARHEVQGRRGRVGS